MKAKVKLDKRALDDAFKDLERQLSETARGVAVTFWDEILQRTPQMWGEMAASWKMTINTPEFVDNSWLVQHQVPLQKGHGAAIFISNEGSAGNETDFKLGDTIWITNGVDHAMAIEEGSIRLRQVNRPGMPVAKALGVIHSRFSRGISYNVAKSLRIKKIEV